MAEPGHTHKGSMMRRALPWLLLLIGIGALGGHRADFQRVDFWGGVAVVSLVAASLIGFRRYPALGFLGASLPFWMFGNAVGVMMFMALSLTMAALIRAMLWPALVGRRVSRGERVPLPRLASGPLIPIAPRVYAGGHRSRVLSWLTRLCFGLSAVLFLLAGTGRTGPEIGGLGLAALIIAVTFAFSNWYSGWVRVRVDERGVHGRTMIVEHTVPWTEVSGLGLRYLFMQGYAVRILYYVVQSPTREVAFPSSMAGADELKATIEAATGLAWATPEFTPNM